MKVTVDEAKEVLREAEEAKRAAWQSYYDAQRRLYPFSLSKKPCPKCGGAMVCDYYQPSEEPNQNLQICGSMFSWAFFVDPYSEAATDSKGKQSAKWHWKAEKLHWKCGTCGYTFDTKVRDAV